MSSRSWIQVLAALLLGVTASHAAPAPKGAAQLVYLLEYVGTDYAGAVRDGHVVSELEYGEMLRFSRQLVREYARTGSASDRVAVGLGELERMIAARAPVDAVWSKTRELLPLLTRALGGGARPSVAPDPARGDLLFRRDCAACHGTAGAGDGRAASEMDPKPSAFSGELVERLSVRQAYGAVAFGIEGTAMPSFGEAYAENELWDVASFVLTLRPGFAPSVRPVEPAFELDELVALSNAELLTELRRVRPSATPGEVDALRASYPAPAGSRGSGEDSGLAIARRMQDAFAGIAARAFPSVVGVSGYARDPGWSPERLRAERGDGWMAANQDAIRYPGFRPVRTGSGFLVDREGYVLCSDRVVRDDRDEVAAIVDVETRDGSHLEANVVGAEPTLDLAVLRIADPRPLPYATPPIPLGDSDLLQAGHWVIGVADPPGSEQDFAVGIVAAPPSRQCYQEDLSATMVQSSLPLSVRGAGGPVLDIDGRVVGIGVERRGAAPGTMGILPINLALNLFESLKVAGSRRSPWIGISVLEIPLARRRMGAGARSVVFPNGGVYVDDVFDPSPAAKAGVRPGDFLLGLGGHRVLSVADFQKWLYISGIGATVELELQRDGQPLRLTLPIEPRPENATTR